ncbi:MAG TPA: hypothetical protein VFR85_16275 [Anaeromyxobacteraceae bacterium]|nr:hypothetical protein [Anaeromyxobacteraceae bacterium]
MLAMALLLLAAAEPAGSRSPPPPVPESEVRAARAAALAWAGEPSVESVQRAAAAQLEGEREHLDSLSRRARQSAWLPRLGAEVEHDERTTRVVGFTGAAESDYLRTSPGWRAGLRVSWELDRLVFSRDELAVAEAASRLARQRQERVERATRLLFQRVGLKAELVLEPPTDALQRAQRELELVRIAAELDALTGGLLARGAGGSGQGAGR